MLIFSEHIILVVTMFLMYKSLRNTHLTFFLLRPVCLFFPQQQTLPVSVGLSTDGLFVALAFGLLLCAFLSCLTVVLCVKTCDRCKRGSLSAQNSGEYSLLPLCDTDGHSGDLPSTKNSCVVGHGQESRSVHLLTSPTFTFRKAAVNPPFERDEKGGREVEKTYELLKHDQDRVHYIDVGCGRTKRPTNLAIQGTSNPDACSTQPLRRVPKQVQPLEFPAKLKSTSAPASDACTDLGTVTHHGFSSRTNDRPMSPLAAGLKFVLPSPTHSGQLFAEDPFLHSPGVAPRKAARVQRTVHTQPALLESQNDNFVTKTEHDSNELLPRNASREEEDAHVEILGSRMQLGRSLFSNMDENECSMQAPGINSSKKLQNACSVLENEGLTSHTVGTSEMTATCSSSLGRICFNILFVLRTNSLEISRLRCESLLGNGDSDFFIKIRLLPEGRPKLSTRIVRGSNSPAFDGDELKFEGFPVSYLRERTLSLRVYRHIFYRSELLGECHYPLSNADSLLHLTSVRREIEHNI